MLLGPPTSPVLLEEAVVSLSSNAMWGGESACAPKLGLVEKTGTG